MPIKKFSESVLNRKNLALFFKSHSDQLLTTSENDYYKV